MAMQHLSAGSTDTGRDNARRTLAVTEGFYSLVPEKELGQYSGYYAGSGSDHPVRFCCFYSESAGRFVQTSVSFAHSFSGRDSSLAHTLILSAEETQYMLSEHISPVNPDMFMNTRSEDLAPPAGETLPQADYRFLQCGTMEFRSELIRKYFTSETFAQFILALFLSLQDGTPLYIVLPGSRRASSFNAVRLMNIVIPAFPSEHRKKLGFLTACTDTKTVPAVNIYFLSGVDLSRKQTPGALCFDLSKETPFISGADIEQAKQYRELIRAVMSNVIRYDNAMLIGYLDDILPKLPQKDRFQLSKISDVYLMWKFLSDSDEEPDASEAKRIVSSFYSFYSVVDNKAAFINRINGYWEKEIEKCKKGGYSPDIEVFRIVNTHYQSFSEEDKRQAKRIWAFMLLYTVENGDDRLLNDLFGGQFVDSPFADDIFRYVIFVYESFIYRKDTNTQKRDIYDRIVRKYISVAAVSNDSSRLFSALASVVRMVDQFYDEMALDRSTQYEMFSLHVTDYFKDSITEKFTSAGLTRKFSVLSSLKSCLCPGDSEKNGVSSSLGKSVYEYFRSTCFVPGLVSGFTAENILRMADDRATIDKLSHDLAGLPELGNIDMIALFNVFCGILTGGRDLSVIQRFGSYVNKPDKQEALRSWTAKYAEKNPELIMSVYANTSCGIGQGGSINYTIDFYKAYSEHYKNLGRKNEIMMRDLNRFIADLESCASRPEMKELGIGAYKEPTIKFINSCFFDKSADRRAVKENEAMLRIYDKVRALRAAGDGKEKKHGLFGKK